MPETMKSLKKLLKEGGLENSKEITRYKGEYHLLHICSKSGAPVPLIISKDLSEIKDHIDLYLMQEKGWTRSDCPICGKSYPHKRGYKPVTCGKFDCLQEANRRGLLDERKARQEEGLKQGEELLAKGGEILAEGRKALEDAEIADNMRDAWKHQQSGAET